MILTDPVASFELIILLKPFITNTLVTPRDNAPALEHGRHALQGQLLLYMFFLAWTTSLTVVGSFGMPQCGLGGVMRTACDYLDATLTLTPKTFFYSLWPLHKIWTRSTSKRSCIRA